MDIDSQRASAEEALNQLRKSIQAFSGKDAKFSDCDRQIQAVKNAIDSYRLEMRALPAEDMGKHRAQLKGLEDGLKQCRTQLDWKRLDAQTARGADALTGVADDGPVTLEQATAIAEHTQKESKASLSRSLGLVVKAEQIGIATLEKMHEQEETFDRIAEDMEDIKANIQRSRKLVGQIARSAAGDRCIQCLCVLITIAVLIMITLAITNKDGGQFKVLDPVRQK
mmetsp:Transcript_14514/g.32080  ORF Transcript_14514/g.32080 Transcript_14514/m.32080 type:complete len:225 (-) Transcript_14514:55-729(-)